MHHKPVLLRETIGLLGLRPGVVAVDATLGSGGHATAILERIGPAGRLIGLDQDPDAIERCTKRFGADARVTLIRSNFRKIDEVLEELKVPAVDAILMDIGMSSDQLEDGKRGFSFQKEGDLDMRMDPDAGNKASHYVMTLPEKELARIIYEYGEERNSRRFAAAIVRERYRNPVDTTSRLCEVIESSLPGRDRFAKGKRPQRNRRNPATRVFQALRILVNDEFGALRDGMDGAVKRLAPRGRLGVISFHSLEDRIVKEKFRELAAKNIAEIVTRKPVVANRSEIIDNPRARSAKLRVIEVKP